jgi:demethylmenaquinone methyltransferase/2-methoxy-6-polyprenyl-1,4-benzoquinol methylase
MYRLIPVTVSNSTPPEWTIPVFARWLGSWRISVERMAFSSTALAQRYDQVAPTWSRTLDRFGFPRAYESLLRRVLSGRTLNAVAARPRILDCGVGTGALSRALAQVLARPFDLDAVDISPRMLECASRSLAHTNLNVALRRADVRDLPYSSGVFDLAMSAHVLEHLADPRAALDEMVRVIKPGGLLIVCITRRSALGKLVHFKWRTHSVSPIDAQKWLQDCGLENAQCLSFDDSPLCNRLSVVCVGTKPDSVA